MKYQKRVIGLLALVAVGAAFGVLFAPAPGKETRKTLKKKALKAQSDLDDVIDKGREEWSRTKGMISNAAAMRSDEVKDLIRFLVEEGKDLRMRLKDDDEGTQEELSHNVNELVRNVVPVKIDHHVGAKGNRIQ